MTDRMLDIHRCADRTEAEMIRIRLAAAGIRVLIRGDDAFSSMGISGGINTAIVAVQVAPDDYDRAAQILEEDKQRRLTLGPWVCDRCSEDNDSTFDLCWKCSYERPDVDVPKVESESSDLDIQRTASCTSEPTERVPSSTNPYHPVLVDGLAAPSSQSGNEPSIEPRIEASQRLIYIAIIAVIFVGALIWGTIQG